MFPFCTPWKCKKTEGFQGVKRGSIERDIDREHWPEMGLERETYAFIICRDKEQNRNFCIHRLK